MSAVAGLGFDHGHRRDYALPIPVILDRLTDRVSHVSIVAIPTVAEARAVRTLAAGRPILHHLSNISPASADGPDMDLLAVQDAISRELDAVWCGEDIGLWTVGRYCLPYFAPPVFDADVADHVSEGILRIAKNSSVPFLAEIPSCAFVAGTLTLGQFFHRLVDHAGCGLVLDLSHVYSYACVTSRSPVEVLESLPLDAVREVHVAGGHVDPKHPFRYVDSHSDPILPVVLELLDHAARKCAQLSAVTYEIGVSLPAETLEADFARVENVLHGASFRPRLGRS